ncbi:MAG: DUF3592 domain-containing protein [Bacteroidetes bacterium]|nr:DUF3592 domain-containing protein [Bacteroidota bacterium]
MGVFTLIFALLISGVCFWVSIKMIHLYFKVNSWKKTPATVISKKIELHKRVSTRRSPYGIKVDYKYIYNNHEYFNNKVYMVELINGQVNHMEPAAQKKLNEINDLITILVNPKDPAESVIFSSGIGLSIVIFFMGALSLLIGIANYN